MMAVIGGARARRYREGQEERHMAHECGCNHGRRVEIGKAVGPIGADDTVGDVARQHARALEIMKAMGINHCCGAGLTLREAAAAAGVPLDTLLDALRDSEKTRA
jgi:hypothetical protein